MDLPAILQDKLLSIGVSVTETLTIDGLKKLFDAVFVRKKLNADELVQILNSSMFLMEDCLEALGKSLEYLSGANKEYQTTLREAIKAYEQIAQSHEISEENRARIISEIGNIVELSRQEKANTEKLQSDIFNKVLMIGLVFLAIAGSIYMLRKYPKLPTS